MAATKLIILAALAACAAGIKTQAACGPQTKVCIADFANAASDPQYECKPATDGAKVVITPIQSQYGAKVCGPGKFFFSPMQCAGDKFEYKQTTVEVDDSAATTDCHPVTFPYGMACYSVSC
mmetsp:Transcript_57209/g.147150  ORF Transcript_57209/g.147150 Transcript_57209/m.147150 type:complete len:122 (+) Transcript_57209:63-428(+)